MHGFTYTDVQHHSSDHGDEVTFGRYLHEERNWDPACRSDTGLLCFAAPATRFCSRFHVDTDCTTGVIPDLGDDLARQN